MGIAKGLNGREGGKVVEVEMGAGEEGGFQGPEGEALGFLGRDFGRWECAQRFEDILV